MPTKPANDKERKRWLDEANTRGIKVEPYNTSVSVLNGKKTNIQVRQVVNDRAWFHIGKKYLYDLDYFVFICIVDRHSLFYRIPQSVMKQLADITTENSYDGRPEFNVNVATNEYYSGNRQFNISDHRDNWNFD